MIVETNKRTIIKSITWRLWATCVLFIIVGFATGSWGIAGALVGVDVVVKTIMYYAHERIWANIEYGRVVEEL